MPQLDLELWRPGIEVDSAGSLLTAMFSKRGIELLFSVELIRYRLTYLDLTLLRSAWLQVAGPWKAASILSKACCHFLRCKFRYTIMPMTSVSTLMSRSWCNGLILWYTAKSSQASWQMTWSSSYGMVFGLLLVNSVPSRSSCARWRIPYLPFNIILGLIIGRWACILFDDGFKLYHKFFVQKLKSSQLVPKQKEILRLSPAHEVFARPWCI